VLSNLFLHGNFQLVQFFVLNFFGLLSDNLVDLRLNFCNLIFFIFDLHNDFLNLRQAARLIDLGNLRLHFFFGLIVHARELHGLLIQETLKVVAFHSGLLEGRLKLLNSLDIIAGIVVSGDAGRDINFAGQGFNLNLQLGLFFLR